MDNNGIIMNFLLMSVCLFCAFVYLCPFAKIILNLFVNIGANQFVYFFLNFLLTSVSFFNLKFNMSICLLKEQFILSMLRASPQNNSYDACFRTFSFCFIFLFSLSVFTFYLGFYSVKIESLLFSLCKNM